MPGNRGREVIVSRRAKILMIVGLAAASAVIVLVRGTIVSGAQDILPSTYSSGRHGCKALYLALEALGLPTERLRKKFTRLGAAGGTVVVIDTWRIPIGKREIAKLKEWVEDGNRAVIFEGLRRESVKTEQYGPVDLKKELTTLRTRSNHVSGAFGLKLKRFPKADREVIPIAGDGLKDVDRIVVNAQTRWNDLDPKWTVIAEDDVGPIAVTRAFGHGAVIAVSDPGMPSNARIDEPNNFRFILALLLKGAPRGAILFDEYHHGRSISESFWSYVASSAVGWIILQLMVGALIFFYGRRASLAGRFRSLSSPSGRSSTEYVESMANIFQSSRAAGAALEAVRARFIGKLSRRAGVSRKAVETDPHAVVRLTGTAFDDRLAGLLTESREIAATEPNETRALKLAGEIARIDADLDRVRPERILPQRR